MRYIYTHTSTEASTGYFSCEPSPNPSLEEALLHLAAHPLDDFMRRHLIARTSSLPPQELPETLRTLYPDGEFPPAIQALLKELSLLDPAVADAFPASASGGPVPGEDDTSLIFLRWSRLPDRKAHQAWGALFDANRRSHRALQAPGETGLDPLYPAPPADTHEPAPERLPPGQRAVFTAPFTVSLPEIHALYASGTATQAPSQRPPAAETAALAEERLSRIGLIAGAEMRHTASLSPVALLRPWTIRLRVRCGRHEHSLEGRATTYGRGLSLADARASCLMEMVERASMYFSVSGAGVEDRAVPTPLRRARRSELLREGLAVLDPNDFPLEVPYGDAPLYWLQGASPAGKPIRIPVQMAGLFCNLDEISLFDAPGSTGIAAGCTMEEARLAAALEILERDAEATTPFSRASCFTLEAEGDALITALLADYKARGINVQFQDLTGPLGVPVYKCFVMSPKGAIAAGHGAGLSSRKALISALTETPFPYPDGGPSGPLLRKLPTVRLHELPDYTLPNPAASLTMLETLLEQNGRPPVYADMTHTALAFPVVRCCIPGMELSADRDAFSRVPYRLYARYLRLFA